MQAFDCKTISSFERVSLEKRVTIAACLHRAALGSVFSGLATQALRDHWNCGPRRT
jgi:hypothetical protein